MSIIFGVDCKAYISATALTAGANSDYITGCTSGTLITNIFDVKLNRSRDKTELNTRGNGDIKSYVGGMQDISITFGMNWIKSAAGFSILNAAFTGKTEIFFAALDGLAATAGSTGPAGNWMVTKFDTDQSNPNIVKVDVELSPSSFSGVATAA